MTERALYDFMRRHRLAVLSSSNAAGPQSALIGVAVTPKLELIFDTLKSSRKYPNLVASPVCSLVMGWDGAQTVQYEGVAEELSGDELAACQAIYFEVWPDGPSRLEWPGIVYFRVSPRWVRFSDFGVDPPVIDTVEFPVPLF